MKFCEALQETFMSSKTASLLALEYFTNAQSVSKSSTAGYSIADSPATLSSGVFVHYLIHCPTPGVRQLLLKLLESLLKALFHKHSLSPVRLYILYSAYVLIQVLITLYLYTSTYSSNWTLLSILVRYISIRFYVYEYSASRVLTFLHGRFY